MPSPYVSQLAKEKGVSLDVAEDRWKRAKASAKNQGHEKDWAYITGIFKTMMGESISRGESMLEQKLTEAVKKIEGKLEGKKLSERILDDIANLKNETVVFRANMRDTDTGIIVTTDNNRIGNINMYHFDSEDGGIIYEEKEVDSIIKSLKSYIKLAGKFDRIIYDPFNIFYQI